MRINLIAENTKLVLMRRIGVGDLVGPEELEAAVVLDILPGIARIDTEDLHPLGFFIKAHDGHVGDDSIGAGPSREPRLVARISAGEISRGRDEIDLVGETLRVLGCHDHRPPAQ